MITLIILRDHFSCKMEKGSEEKRALLGECINWVRFTGRNGNGKKREIWEAWKRKIGLGNKLDTRDMSNHTSIYIYQMT